MTPSTYVESIRRTLADAGHRASLLRAMDFNCWEMFRDTVRLGRGGGQIRSVNGEFLFHARRVSVRQRQASHNHDPRAECNQSI